MVDTRLKARGLGGELRGAGRLAAVLGAWSYQATPAGWLVGAKLTWQDDRLVDRAEEIELRLHMGRAVHIARGPDVHLTRTPGRTDYVCLTGEHHLEKTLPYGRAVARDQPERPDRERRIFLPGGGSRTVTIAQPGDRGGWQARDAAAFAVRRPWQS